MRSTSENDQPPNARVQAIRKAYRIGRPAFARLLGVDEAILQAWEKTGAVPAKESLILKKVEQVLSDLGRVVRKNFISTWLETPNDAAVSAGSRTPLELMEKGKYDKIEAMIYFLESGTPI